MITGIITARGGSKGIPGKNIRLLAGKPLIAWTIEAALASSSLHRVIVSTDDADIARIAAEWGAEVPFLRPAELATDTARHADVIAHALQWLETADGQMPEYFLLLQPTLPFRTADDIEGAIAMKRIHHADAVVSVTEVKQHPYLMKRVLQDGTIATFMESDIPYLRRQDLPPLYILNGAIYLLRSATFLQQRTVFPDGACAYIMPQEHSHDIDTPMDFFIAQLILEHRDAYSL